jgi:hypothetical protein
MKKARNISNLDKLEKEIYRLQLDAKNIENKLDDNFDHLHHNFSSMMMNSFCHREKSDKNGKGNFFDSAFKNEKVNSFVNRITGHIADRAAKGIDELLDRLFKQKK